MGYEYNYGDTPVPHRSVLWLAVIENMDLVYKIEAQGSGSGKPKQPVTIIKSGQIVD